VSILIAFGPDGWYGVISDGIDFENMGIVAQAIADMLREQKTDHPLLAVGYDTRFLSREYAWHIQKVLVGNGIRVLFHRFPVTTSILSYSTKRFNCDLGIMVTGGGRPARYSGLTFRDAAGLPVSQKWMNQLFQFLYRRYPRAIDGNRHLLEVIDVTQDYARLMDEYIDFDLIRSKKPAVIYDAHYGSTGDFMVSFLKERGINCLGLRTKPNPGFNGSLPQPIDRNMSVLSRIVVKRNGTVGFFFNGDGSRLGVVDMKGNILDFCRFSSMIFEEWVASQGMIDIILTGPTTPSMVNILVGHYGGKCERWFDTMNKLNKLQSDNKWIRWEEFSMAFGRVLPDFDATFQSLILLQGLCRWDFDLEAWMKSTDNMVNVGCMEEKHMAINDELWNKKKKWILDASIPLPFAKSINFIEEDTDKVKLHLSNGSWVILRYAGIESTLQIVVESTNNQDATLIMNDVVDWVRKDI